MSNPRREKLVAGEVYHIYNRSIGKVDIFHNSRLLSRALDLAEFCVFPHTIRYSRLKTMPNDLKNKYLTSIKKKLPLVEIYSYSYMPNHFHFLLRQISDEGIIKFVSSFQNGFAKYFNILEDRDGSLFKRPFKSKRIATDEELLHVSRYIHLNPVTSYLMEFSGLRTSVLTSFSCYLGVPKDSFVNTDFVLKVAGGKKQYERFVANQVDYQRRLAEIKSLALE